MILFIFFFLFRVDWDFYNRLLQVLHKFLENSTVTFDFLYGLEHYTAVLMYLRLHFANVHAYVQIRPASAVNEEKSPARRQSIVWNVHANGHSIEIEILHLQKWNCSVEHFTNKTKFFERVTLRRTYLQTTIHIWAMVCVQRGYLHSSIWWRLRHQRVDHWPKHEEVIVPVAIAPVFQLSYKYRRAHVRKDCVRFNTLSATSRRRELELNFDRWRL